MADGSVTILRDEEGKAAFAVLPIARYLELTGADEDDLDARRFDEAEVEDDGFRLPHEQASRLIRRENVVKVLREWRGMDQATLARRCDTTANYLSQIETGARKGIRMIPALATALDVPEETLKAYL